VRCFSTIPEESIDEDTMTDVKKRNGQMPKEIFLPLNTKHSAQAGIQRFIDNKKRLLWTIELKKNSNNCVHIEKGFIKESDDKDPLTWFDWKITPLNPGNVIVKLSCTYQNRIIEEEEILITIAAHQ